MIFQDASQTNTFWCIGKLPEPAYISTANGEYWIVWGYARSVA